MAALRTAVNPACTDCGLGCMGGFIIAVLGDAPDFNGTVLIAEQAGETGYRWRPAAEHEDAFMRAAGTAELALRRRAMPGQ
ncbi:hypothetical protein WKW79_36420 [Variovorax robiniae]|uniref:Uncharacterized protein n=1 Tax=Variovorax robiniae TaxID=1836199 RepID=A0ABU8XJM9_9BURK